MIVDSDSDEVLEAGNLSAGGSSSEEVLQAGGRPAKRQKAQNTKDEGKPVVVAVLGHLEPLLVIENADAIAQVLLQNGRDPISGDSPLLLGLCKLHWKLESPTSALIPEVEMMQFKSSSGRSRRNRITLRAKLLY